MEENTRFAFVGDSHIAFWALNIYFPLWECMNYGVPGEGLQYVEAFKEDTSDRYVVMQMGTNDIYQLNEDNMDSYVERYVKAVLAVRSLRTFLFCIFPRNDYDDYSRAVNRFIRLLNQKIYEKVEKTEVIYIDVFDKLLLDGRLNPELTLDDVHLNGKGYSVLTEVFRQKYRE